MSGVRWVMPPITVSSGSGATLTLFQLIAAANRRVRVDRITLSGKGTMNTDTPTTFEVLDASTAGTAAANNPVKANASDDETLGVTGAKTFTAEPTAGAVKASRAVHPQASYDFVFPPGRELFIAGGGRLDLRALSPTQANDWVVTAEGEE